MNVASKMQLHPWLPFNRVCLFILFITLHDQEQKSILHAISSSTTHPHVDAYLNLKPFLNENIQGQMKIVILKCWLFCVCQYRLLWYCCRGGECRYLLFSECLAKSLSPSPSPSIFCVLSISTLPSISLSLYLLLSLYFTLRLSPPLSLSHRETPVEYSHQREFFFHSLEEANPNKHVVSCAVALSFPQ